MKRRRAATTSGPSTTWSRVLKWVGGATAILTLVLGAQQVANRVGEALHRRREASLLVEQARQQASRDAFADAWASLDRAEALHPGDAVDEARIAVAFEWLREARTGPKLKFSPTTDAVTPALDRALVTAQGRRRADLLAHLGWATFLRTRDGVEGNPAARYREALDVDPKHAYANAMLGHWLMWTGKRIEEAQPWFVKALASASEERPFIRRLQISSLYTRGYRAEVHLLRIADDMRQRGESLDADAADRLFRTFSFRYAASARPAEPIPGVPAANLEAIYEWVAAARSVEDLTQVNALRERMRQAERGAAVAPAAPSPR